MNLDTIRMLYDYHYHASGLVWDCVVELNDVQYTQTLDYSVGSIHEQVVHTMAAEYIWFSRLNGQSPDRLWTGADFADRDAVRKQWDAVEQTVRTTLGRLTEADLGRNLHYKSTSGAPYATPLTGVLLHVVNHATDHRAQTLAMIHTLGGRTVAQDLIDYLRERLS